MNKPDKDLAVPKAVSIKKDLYEEAMSKANSLGLSFSQLVCLLIKKEIDNKGDFIIKQKKMDDGFSNW